MDLHLTGGACLNANQTQCSDVQNPTSTVARQINTALTEQRATWRKTVNDDLGIYPIVSIGVAYSFRIR
jgi:hypothetical protein